MGKHEVGTPKYIANKMKSKGLQKLRWYCQMCQKQCRDENGFKCHTTSESHQRNLLMFADNSKKYMDEFSKEFLDAWMDLLRRRFGTKRIAANKVYQEYIADRNHVHMNATRWVTLTGFVKWLGRTGKCVVDETEKGWFIQYIDRDPETLAREERKSKKKKMDRDDEDKIMEFVEKQIERGQSVTSEMEEKTPSELVRNDEEEKIKLQLKLQPPKSAKYIPAIPLDVLAGSSKGSNDTFLRPTTPKIKKEEGKRKLSGIEETIKEEQALKRRKEETWLSKGIVVKVITSSLGEKYQNQKGVVEKVFDDYLAVVRMLTSNHKLKLDQAHLQTVIPQPGKLVKILKGSYKGQTAYMKEVLTDKFRAVLSIGSDSHGILKEFPYDHFSKLHTDLRLGIVKHYSQYPCNIARILTIILHDS